MIFFIAAALYGCRHKCQDPARQECENYNSCYGKNPLKADFVIEVGDGYGNWYDCNDTIMGLSVVRFRVTCEGDSFVWNTGGQIIRGKQFSKSMFDTGTMELMLTVYKRPYLNCFPYDNGVDTVIKQFYVWSNWDNYFGRDVWTPLPIWGVYEGYWQSRPTDRATVVLKDTMRYDVTWDMGKKHEILSMKGIPDANSTMETCNPFEDDFQVINYNGVYIYKDISTICPPYYQPPVKASAHLARNNKDIEIAAEYKNANNIWIKDYFKGTKK